MLRIRLFGKKPVYTVTVNLYKNSTSYPLNGTQPTVTLNGVTRTAVGGVVTFTDVEDGSYTIQIGSTTYTSSYSENLTVSGANKTVDLTLTGTYQVKAEFVNTDGGYINALSVYLRTSGGSNLTSGTTDSGGDITFSSGILIAYNTSYRLYVPEQIINGIKYNTATFTLTTANSSNDLGGNMVYWRQNRITSAVAGVETLLIDCPFSMSSLFKNQVNNKIYDGYYGDLPSVIAADGIWGYKGIECGLIYDLGGVYNFKDLKWELTFKANVCGRANGGTGNSNSGVRLGTKSASSTAYSSIGINVSYDTWKAILLSSSTGTSWTKTYNTDPFQIGGLVDVFVDYKMSSDAGSNMVAYGTDGQATMDMGAVGRYLSIILDDRVGIKDVKLKVWL